MHSLLPMKPLYETNHLLAYFHPQPAYPFHIILLPKNKIPDMLAFDIVKDAGFLQDVTLISQKIVKEYQLEKIGYRLILNGGPNQDFPILHFHLIAEEIPTEVKETND